MPKTRQHQQSWSLGPSNKEVIIVAISEDEKMAVCRDRNGYEHRVPMHIMRAKGAPPEVGELWIIDRSFGTWTFAAVILGEE